MLQNGELLMNLCRNDGEQEDHFRRIPLIAPLFFSDFNENPPLFPFIFLPIQKKGV